MSYSSLGRLVQPQAKRHAPSPITHEDKEGTKFRDNRNERIGNFIEDGDSRIVTFEIGTISNIKSTVITKKLLDSLTHRTILPNR